MPGMGVRSLSLTWRLITFRFFSSTGEEKLLHLSFQKLPRLRFDHREPVFVDEHGLVAQPLLPGLLRHLLVDALAEFARIGRTLQPRQFLTQQDASDRARHPDPLLLCP